MKFLYLARIYYFILIISNSQIFCLFQFSLFNKINSELKENNIIISPLSIYQAISLVTNGANEQTQKELLYLLDNKDIEEINMINMKILNKIKDKSSIEIANAIMSKTAPLNTFTEIAKNTFN